MNPNFPVAGFRAQDEDGVVVVEVAKTERAGAGAIHSVSGRVDAPAGFSKTRRDAQLGSSRAHEYALALAMSVDPSEDHNE